MTAEVGVMNSIGIGLAADSAVTIPVGGKRKVYSSVDKLFQLSEKSPVGIMIYGSASILGVPWETIIKLYRAKIGNESLPYLQDYVDSFLKHLKNNKKLFISKEQDQFVAVFSMRIFLNLQNLFKLRLEEELEKTKKNKQTNFTETQLQKILSELIENEIKTVEKYSNKLAYLPKNFSQKLNQYKNSIIDSRKSVFETFPFTKNMDTQIVKLVLNALESEYFIKMGAYSGLVIAGFGNDEHFPSLADIYINGIVSDYPLYVIKNKGSIKSDGEAYVAPFAQKEMVFSFMYGIDPFLREDISLSTEDLFKDVVKNILDEVSKKNSDLGKQLDKRIQPNIDKLLTGLNDAWDKISENNYWKPVMKMVSSLPKDELGAMAESLVNLTKFKRKVSDDEGTVGGPIDVAIITKGDGFIWVKRKHYFHAELNPRYISRFFNK